MGWGTMPTHCPVCRTDLRPSKGKLNLEVDECPQGHGAFVDSRRITQVVAETTAERLRELPPEGEVDSVRCPSCSTAMATVHVGELALESCPSCGGMWFDTGDLRQFSHDWRSRAYGQESFASRADVIQEAQPFYPAEVISGVLTDFELSLDP